MRGTEERREPEFQAIWREGGRQASVWFMRRIAVAIINKSSYSSECRHESSYDLIATQRAKKIQEKCAITMIIVLTRGIYVFNNLIGVTG